MKKEVHKLNGKKAPNIWNYFFISGMTIFCPPSSSDSTTGPPSSERRIWAKFEKTSSFSSDEDDEEEELVEDVVKSTLAPKSPSEPRLRAWARKGLAFRPRQR